MRREKIIVPFVSTEDMEKQRKAREKLKKRLAVSLTEDCFREAPTLRFLYVNASDEGKKELRSRVYKTIQEGFENVVYKHTINEIFEGRGVQEFSRIVIDSNSSIFDYIYLGSCFKAAFPKDKQYVIDLNRNQLTEVII